MNSPSIARRLGASAYEFVLLFGIFFIVGVLIQALQGLMGLQLPRWLQQIILFIAMGGYFAYCWRRGGQTLAQKTWHIQIQSASASTHPTISQSWMRYTAGALLGTLPALVLIQLVFFSSLVATVNTSVAFISVFLLLVTNWLALLGTSLLRRDRRALHEVISHTCSVYLTHN